MPVGKDVLGRLEVHEAGLEAEVNAVVVHFKVQLHEQGGFYETRITALISEC